MSNDLDLTSLITGQNLVLLGGCFALTATLRASFKEFFADKSWGHRLLPILPLVFGMVGALAGVCEGVTTTGSKIMLGLIAGFLAGHGFKIGKTSVLGFGLGGDDEEEEKKDPPAPPVAPTGSSPPAGGESAEKK